MSHPFEHSIGKPMVDFLFVIILLFCYLLRLRRYNWKSVEVSVFRRRWATLSQILDGKGVARQPLFVQKTRVIALSCGIKISAVHCLVLSQCTNVTDRQTDKQNCDS